MWWPGVGGPQWHPLGPFCRPIHSLSPPTHPLSPPTQRCTSSRTASRCTRSTPRPASTNTTRRPRDVRGGGSGCGKWSFWSAFAPDSRVVFVVSLPSHSVVPRVSCVLVSSFSMSSWQRRRPSHAEAVVHCPGCARPLAMQVPVPPPASLAVAARASFARILENCALLNLLLIGATRLCPIVCNAIGKMKLFVPRSL